MAVYNAPCKGCADRALGCHGVCKDFLEYKRLHKEELDWEKTHKPPIIGKKSFTGTSPAPGKHRRTRTRGSRY